TTWPRDWSSDVCSSDLTIIPVAAGLAAIALTPAAAAPPAASDKDVRVVNTPAEPVPVAVQGTPTVGISASANTVRIAPPAAPLQIGRASCRESEEILVG